MLTFVLVTVMTTGAVRFALRLRSRRRIAAVEARLAAAPDETQGRWRDQRRYGVALALALEEIARSLRSGTSLLLAVGEAAAQAPAIVAGDLSTVTEDAGRVGLVTALAAWRRRRPRSDVCLAVAALAMAAETGGNQAAAIDGVAAGLRQRLA